MVSEHFPGDPVARRATGALDLDDLLLAEKIVGALAPRAEDGEDFLQIATAVEAEAAGFQEGGFLDGIDLRDALRSDVLKPFLIAIRLCGEEGEMFILQPEGAGRALLRLLVEL